MTTTIFSLIQKEIKSGFLGLMIFFLAIFLGFESYSFFSRVREIKNLVIGQVDSLASNKAMAQDYLAIQPEVTRFVNSLKRALPYNVEVRVRLDGKLLAGDDKEEFRLIPRTEIIHESVLPSGQNIEVTAEIFHGRAIVEAMVLLLMICGACSGAYAMLTRKVESSVRKISDPLRETIDWVDRLSSNLPNTIKEKNKTDCRNISELSLLNGAVGRLTVEIESLGEKLLIAGKNLAKIELAEDVGHDIRTPLTTIDCKIRSLPSIPADERAKLEKLIFRIMNVLDDLAPSRGQAEASEMLTPSVDPTSKLRPEFIYPLVQEILAEKNALLTERGGIDVHLGHHNGGMAVVANVNRKDFTRALSNLIDNALEAIDGSGMVTVEIAQAGPDAKITVVDTGKGIPADQLAQIGHRGISFGKTEGSGIGLNQARKAVEGFGGRLEIVSTVGIGTTITLTIPTVSEQKMISDGVTLATGQTLVVVDDDPLILNAWRNKLKGTDLDLRMFTSPEELLSSNTHEVFDRAAFVVDLEFKNSDMNGLDLIRKLEIETRAVLISGRWNAPEIAFQCEHFGIMRFPKALLEYFEVKIAKSSQSNCGHAVGVDAV